MNVYIGIDPGSREAGIGVISEVGNYIAHYRLSNWTPYEFKSVLIDIQEKYHIKLVAIEKVGTRPGQGIVSAGKFLKATGIIIGIIVGLDIPFIEVAPQTWKKISPILPSKKGESATEKKRRALTYIQQRFPEAKLSKSIDHNVADALCMAEWLVLRNK